ncbi:hypothetical protein [Paenibacillus sp. Soil766]|uniref:hypothetical protein n=1 Tax=Paenibacillus sp. Soil766 TaxID=1736404 RepID=UPI000A582310|nr:hypothetical protein [Paenibacillus sp. Soil766]
MDALDAGEAAGVFRGVLQTGEDVQKMALRRIVFAMANPTPDEAYGGIIFTRRQSP